jgi:peroxiredoxin
MRMIRYARYAAAALAAGVLSLGLAQAGSEKLKLGDPAPNFTGLPGVDGKSHSLSDYKDKDVLVIAITCNHCPVAVAYEDRIIDFAKKYAGSASKVAFVAINVNNLPADKLDKMKVRAEQKGFTFDYLYDATQKVGRALNATVTPEFYVFDKSRKLVYWGAMDNDNNASKANQNYLIAAVEATLKGSTPTTTKTRARGCSVKYETGTR